MTENWKMYQVIIGGIARYYQGKNFRYRFLHGGCYWLATTLHKYIPDSEIMISYALQHCGCRFDKGVYDITGRISGQGFHVAEEKDFLYMEKHFRPHFDTESVSDYLKPIILQYMERNNKYESIPL